MRYVKTYENEKERNESNRSGRIGSPDVLQLREVDKPAVKDDEVLVRARAASSNPWDWHFMRGLPYISRPQAGWRKPKNAVLGSNMAGEIEAVGKDVTRFRPGDQVFGFVGHGGFAEYASVSDGELGLKPANLTFEQAATVSLAAMTLYRVSATRESSSRARRS